MAEKSCTIRTRKFMTNRLLMRRQFVSAGAWGCGTCGGLLSARGRSVDVVGFTPVLMAAAVRLCRSSTCCTPGAQTCPRWEDHLSPLQICPH